MTPWRLLAAVLCYAAAWAVPDTWLWGWAEPGLIVAAAIFFGFGGWRSLPLMEKANAYFNSV